MKIRMLVLSAAAAVAALALFCGYAFWPRTVLPASAVHDPTFTLVIDAGHGGEDGGAVSVSGRKESEINLEIAKRAECLAALVGICPRMVRDGDVSIHTQESGTIAQKKVSDLKNRVKLIRETDNPVLISIHQNHFAQEKYFGAQVFYSDTPHSKAYAERMQQDLADTLDRRNRRQCKPAQGVYLMEHVSCTAVLVECGFLSNFAEEQLLQQENYQKKLTLAMLKTIALYGSRGIDNEI